MKIKRFDNFINESMVTDDLITKLPEDYKEIQEDILEHIDNTLSDINDEYRLSDLKKFIDGYIIDGKDSDKINGLIEDSDLSNFYHKHQVVIDKFLNDDGYLEDSPKEHQSYGLHEIMVDGTKYTIFRMIEKIKEVI